MTVVELARLARDARNLQREYFRSRATEKLRECKAAERKLDEAVEAILNPKLETLPLPFFGPDYGGEG